MLMPVKLQQYAKDNQISGITPHTLQAISEHRDGYTVARARQFLEFYQRIQSELLSHPVITENAYTEWFSHGQMSEHQLRQFIVQFSVFSNLFIVAQLQKTINADSLESMHASKEILVNELGVVFHKTTQGDLDVQSELVSEEGSVEGGVFHFAAAHFEWLYALASKIGLGFNDIGKRRHGTEATLFYCDELLRLYASENYTTAQSASFAVENWASSGFWKQLITGLKSFQKIHNKNLPIHFFTYHDRIEAQHALHTLDELEDIYFAHSMNEDQFIEKGNEMLDAVEVFWNGLDRQRKLLAH